MHVLRLTSGSLSYKNPVLGAYEKIILGENGQLSNLQVLEESYGDSGPSLKFDLKQDNQTFVETSIAMVVPIVPFNNEININLDGKADVTLSKGSVATDYQLTAKVYLR